VEGTGIEPVIVNLGPQHPSTHGVFRLRVVMDGETIQDVEPIFGYLHRGTEKLAEERAYTQIVTLTDRMDYTAAMTNNQAFVLAVERLAGIQVPERGQYLRVIAAELQRIAAHLIFMGFSLDELGAFHTPIMYSFRDRERILDLFEMLCGARITLSYMRPGGVFQDAPPDFWQAFDRFLLEMPHYLDELEALVTENEILVSRTKGLGPLPASAAINASISGPVLRASGIPWDLRKKDPYDAYARLDFDVPIGTNGDTYDRIIVRLYEMRQSLRILKQARKEIPNGPVRATVPYFIRPPEGEAYGHVEAPKGELGFYLVSRGGISPWRCKVRSPSFVNLTALRDMLMGHKVADLVVIFGSIDINMGEVDR
jgi:NADH-quinone oxidoreductase subunit D